MQQRFPQSSIRSEGSLRHTTPTRSTLNSESHASEPASQSISHRGTRVGPEVLLLHQHASARNQHTAPSRSSRHHHVQSHQPLVQTQVAPMHLGGQHRSFFDRRHVSSLPQGTQNTQMNHVTNFQPGQIRRQLSAPLYGGYPRAKANHQLERRQLSRSVSFRATAIHDQVGGSGFGANRQQQASTYRNQQQIGPRSATSSGLRIPVRQSPLTHYHGQNVQTQGYPQRTVHQRGVQRTGETADAYGQRRPLDPSYPVVANSQAYHFSNTPTNRQFKFHQTSNVALGENARIHSEVCPDRDRAGSANQMDMRKQHGQSQEQSKAAVLQHQLKSRRERTLQGKEHPRFVHPPSRVPLDSAQQYELAASHSQKTFHHHRESDPNQQLPAVRTPHKQSKSGPPLPGGQQESNTANNHEKQRCSRRGLIQSRGEYEEVQRSITQLLSSNEFLDDEESESDGQPKSPIQNSTKSRLSKPPIQNANEPVLLETTRSKSSPRQDANSCFEQENKESSISHRRKSESAPPLVDDTKTSRRKSRSTEQVHSEWHRDRTSKNERSSGEEVHSSKEKETESSRLIEMAVSRLQSKNAHGAKSGSTKSLQPEGEEVKQLTRRKSKSQLSSAEDESTKARTDLPRRRKSGKFLMLEKEGVGYKLQDQPEKEATQALPTSRCKIAKPTNHSRRSKSNPRVRFGESDSPIQQKEQDRSEVSARRKSEPRLKPDFREPFATRKSKDISVSSSHKATTSADLETRSARIVLLGENPASEKRKNRVEECSVKTQSTQFQQRSQRPDTFTSPRTPRSLESRSPRLVLLSPDLQAVTRKKTYEDEKTPKSSEKPFDKFKLKTCSPRAILCPHSPRPCRKGRKLNHK